jgi:hypothetical protein
VLGSVSVASEVSIAIALEAFRSIWSEVESNVTCRFEVLDNVLNRLAMLVSRVGGVFGNLVYRIHDVRSGSLAKVVQLAYG